MNVKKELLELEPGDRLAYNDLYQALENSDIQWEAKSLYTDSAGFLEEWRIGERGSIVIDALNGAAMVRKTQHLDEELK